MVGRTVVVWSRDPKIVFVHCFVSYNALEEQFAFSETPVSSSFHFENLDTCSCFQLGSTTKRLMQMDSTSRKLLSYRVGRFAAHVLFSGPSLADSFRRRMITTVTYLNSSPNYSYVITYPNSFQLTSLLHCLQQNAKLPPHSPRSPRSPSQSLITARTSFQTLGLLQQDHFPRPAILRPFCDTTKLVVTETSNEVTEIASVIMNLLISHHRAETLLPMPLGPSYSKCLGRINLNLIHGYPRGGSAADTRGDAVLDADGENDLQVLPCGPFHSINPFSASWFCSRP
jgi:hypothetical protein